MSVSPVTNNPFFNALTTQHPTTDSGEATRSGTDVAKDGDSDDKRVTASSTPQPQAAPQAPAINTSGEVVGTVINTHA